MAYSGLSFVRVVISALFPGFSRGGGWVVTGGTSQSSFL